MKFFALFVVMMMVAVQAFALPAAPAPAAGPQGLQGPEAVAADPSGAPKVKRDLLYYPIVPTLKYYYPATSYSYFYQHHPYQIIY